MLELIPLIGCGAWFVIAHRFSLAFSSLSSLREPE